MAAADRVNIYRGRNALEVQPMAPHANVARLPAVLLHVALPLILAGSVYAVARERFAVVSIALRIEHPALQFVVFNVPDALWTYAMTALLALVWRASVGAGRTCWLLAALVLALSLEAGQHFKFVPGTFDYLDIAVSGAAWLAAILITHPKESSV